MVELLHQHLNMLLPRLHLGYVAVGLERVWLTIINHPDVSTLDDYRAAIVVCLSSPHQLPLLVTCASISVTGAGP